MTAASAGSLFSASTTALWLDPLSPIIRRPPLRGDHSVDVAIVGGGFSGLWTAYYLKRLDPSLDITVIEKHYCGFGASGRNGGWAVGELAGSYDTYSKRSSPQEAMRLSRAVFDAVDEVGRVVAAESIDCGYAKGGWIRLARTSPQADRQRAQIAHDRKLGFTEDDLRLLEPDEARTLLNGSDVRSGIFFAHCAALDPARLARGLAATIEAMGVRIAEDTTVTEVTDAGVNTTTGSIAARVVVRATEAYTRDLAGERRSILPGYAIMIATERLTDAMFDEIGLASRPTFSDDRFLVTYGQRTEDNRIAFGGGGLPYLWGSRIDSSVESRMALHQEVHDALIEIVPQLAGVEITHRWGAVLGIPSNWTPGLKFNAHSGRGVLGGYVGEGVAAANLAGQTMADLIVGADTERTSLPWVGVESRRWPVEPLRWLGVRTSSRLLASADRREARTDRAGWYGKKLVGLLTE